LAVRSIEIIAMSCADYRKIRSLPHGQNSA